METGIIRYPSISHKCPMGLDGGLLICHQLWYFVWIPLLQNNRPRIVCLLSVLCMAVAKGPVGQVLAGPTFRSILIKWVWLCTWWAWLHMQGLCPCGYYTGWLLLLKLVWRVWLFQLNLISHYLSISQGVIWEEKDSGKEFSA